MRACRVAVASDYPVLHRINTVMSNAHCYSMDRLHPTSARRVLELLNWEFNNVNQDSDWMMPDFEIEFQALCTVAHLTVNR